MLIEVNGVLGSGVGPKDVILAVIGKIGTAGGTGHVVEYAGSTFRDMSMEGRMNGLQHVDRSGRARRPCRPDDKTIAYVMGRPYAPKGAAWSRRSPIGAPCRRMRAPIRQGSASRRRRHRAARQLGDEPPGCRPNHRPCSRSGAGRRPVEARGDAAFARIYGPGANTRLVDVPVQRVFIGSCTNSRIEDLRAAAAIAKGRRVADGVRALVVPGSGLVKHQAEEEGLDRVFLEAGFEWREPAARCACR